MAVEKKNLSESWIIGLIASVQFVNILDFMMVMPLGPDFAQSLGIATGRLGIIGGSYTMSACVSGLIGSLFFDRFDRKKALLLALAGLSIATLLGGFSWDYNTLVISRILAGAFGGPATAMALSIIADTIPPERRGRAMGTVMMSFSLASIFGVPAGLEMARLGGWHTPFFAVGALGFSIAILVGLKLPAMTAHLNRLEKRGHPLSVFKDFKTPAFLMSFAMMFVAMFGGFILIPNFSAYFQNNIGFPRKDLGLLYMAGGFASLITMRLAGKFIDKHSNLLVNTVATILLCLLTYFGYVLFPPAVPIPVMFVGFMICMSSRNVSVQSLTSLVPKPEERASFNSIQSAVQHFASALGAFLSTQILDTSDKGELIHFDQIALLSLGCALVVPAFVKFIEPRVRKNAPRP